MLEFGVLINIILYLLYLQYTPTDAAIFKFQRYRK